MTRRHAVLVGLVLGSMGVSLVANGQQISSKERKKIETLIERVEAKDDVKFVRNGQEYDAKTAARFLRGKWKANEDEIRTAKDFIAKAGTFSTTSGKPYLIRFKSGKEIKSAEFLMAELRKVESSRP